MASKKDSSRLTRSSDFSRLRKQSRRISSCQWMVWQVSSNGAGGNRWGWTISGKVANAVLRNKLKRWCRQVIRDCISEVGPDHTRKFYDINVVLRPMGKEFYRELSYDKFFHEFQKTFQRL